MYKKSNFPLYPSGSTRWSKDNFVEEKPLIINPMLDNPLELFILVLRNSQGQDILELQVKDSLKEVNDYLYQKAKKTISVFGLGNCEDNEHENPQVHNCRLRVLNEHFGRFYELAKARKKGIGEFMKALRDKPTRSEYGFIEFIAKEKFEILT